MRRYFSAFSIERTVHLIVREITLHWQFANNLQLSHLAKTPAGGKNGPNVSFQLGLLAVCAAGGVCEKHNRQRRGNQLNLWPNDTLQQQFQQLQQPHTDPVK